MSKKHLVVPKDYHPSSYNIEEIFGSLIFFLNKEEVGWKRVKKVKQANGTLEEM